MDTPDKGLDIETRGGDPAQSIPEPSPQFAT